MPMQFANWYRSLPSNQITGYRNQIIERCGITKNIFYNWLYNRNTVPKLAQEAIIEIAGEPVLFEDLNLQEIISENPKD